MGFFFSFTCHGNKLQEKRLVTDHTVSLRSIDNLAGPAAMRPDFVHFVAFPAFDHAAGTA